MDHVQAIAARDLRKRLGQPGRNGLAPDLKPHDRALLCRALQAFEDVLDRVTLLEQQHASLVRSNERFLNRLDFLMHLARLLGHEDWTVPDPDEPGALATAAPACAHGASGPAGSTSSSSSPDSVDADAAGELVGTPT